MPSKDGRQTSVLFPTPDQYRQFQDLKKNLKRRKMSFSQWVRDQIKKELGRGNQPTDTPIPTVAQALESIEVEVTQSSTDIFRRLANEEKDLP